MPRFAANLTMLFTEYPVVERIERAAAAGFGAVEILFPYSEDANALRAALDRTGVELTLFNFPAGDFAAGDRGIANNPDRVSEFRDSVARALDLAAVLRPGRFNCLVGKELPGVPLEDQLAVAADNLAFAAEETKAAGFGLGIEPLNPYDAPGFLVPNTTAAIALMDRVGNPHLQLQYDFYHAQRAEGNITQTYKKLFDRIGYIQVADSPDRHQPGTGEINYEYVYRVIDESGYDGWVALEYNPPGRTEDSFGPLSGGK